MKRPPQIPADATPVYQGDIFTVWQWPQQMFDGSVVTFEAMTRPDNVVVLPVTEEEGELYFYYANQQQPGRDWFFSFFGGRLDPDEDPLTAAKRELLEEAGLASDDWQFVKSHPFGHKIYAESHFFIARNCRVAAEQALDCGEKIEVHKKPLTELPQIVQSTNFRETWVKTWLASSWNEQEWNQLCALLKCPS